MQSVAAFGKILAKKSAKHLYVVNEKLGAEYSHENGRPYRRPIKFWFLHSLNHYSFVIFPSNSCRKYMQA